MLPNIKNVYARRFKKTSQTESIMLREPRIKEGGYSLLDNKGPESAADRIIAIDSTVHDHFMLALQVKPEMPIKLDTDFIVHQ